MIKISTKAAELAKQARKRRWALAIYHYTGSLPALPSPPHFQTSSSTITPATLFVCHQKAFTPQA